MEEQMKNVDVLENEVSKENVEGRQRRRKERTRKRSKRRRFIGIAIIICICLGIGAVIVVPMLQEKSNQVAEKDDKQEVKEISKEEEIARNVAVTKFSELGESISSTELEVQEIQRQGDIYYYISSKENTVEVRKEDNEIVRVNSILVK